MEPAKAPMTDSEIFDRLKYLAAQWFRNADILILEELFRRYKNVREASRQKD